MTARRKLRPGKLLRLGSSPALTFLLLLSGFVFSQDVSIDRNALEDFLAKKNLKISDIYFDAEHHNSMPNGYMAWHSAPNRDEKQLKIYRRIQKQPITFPEEFQKLAGRISGSEMWESIHEVLDQKFKRQPLPEPKQLDGIPEDLKKPIGTIVAALETKNPQVILDSIMAARATLNSFMDEVNWEKEDMVVTSSGKPTNPDLKLFIKFGGNDSYKGGWAGATKEHPLKVVIDTGGDDVYDAGSVESSLGAGAEGIGILVDLAGNDKYVSKGSLSQGAGYHGTGILIDESGSDTYVAEQYAQGVGEWGIGILMDNAGNDSYEMLAEGQGCGGVEGIGILLDREGSDTYVGRDPMNGGPLVIKAPQDEKHNANMVQGAGTGNYNIPEAGGIGMLIDLRGNDTYKSGCWSQGVGYFQGLGALIDCEGNDYYEAWVYIMGSGAHGGGGIFLDKRGDDTYKVGGWNSLSMTVDYGFSVFIDGAGNDKYSGIATGCGWTTGLGISIFQDSGGDDVYETKGDPNQLGYGRWYEKEDYNADGKITPAEKRHWGIFLDLAGNDRYPNDPKFGNGKRWDPDAFCGGIDIITPEETARAAKLKKRQDELLDLMTKWTERKDVKAFFDKRAELQTLRNAALDAISKDDLKKVDETLKKLTDFWAQRKKYTVKLDVKEAAKELDSIDPSWRTKIPLVGANVEEATLTLENSALTVDERSRMIPDPDISKLQALPKSLAQTVNDYREMLGRAPIKPDETLMKFADAAAKAGKTDGKVTGYDGEAAVLLTRASKASDLLVLWKKTPADHRILIDEKWRVAGFAVSSSGAWVLVPGRTTK